MLLCVACAASTASHSGYWANLIDIGGPQNAGILCGVSNTVATVPGIVGNLITGAVLGSGGWSVVFMVCVAMYLVSCCMYVWLAGVRRLEIG